MTALSLKPVLSDQDIREMASLATEIWKEHFTPIIGADQVEYMVEKFQSEQALHEQIKHGYLYFVLVFENKQIGYIGLRLNEDCLFLSKLYIQKEYRGNGFSRMMLQHAENIALQNAKPVIRLTCNRHNAGSLAVYKKIGFQIVREEKADIGNGFVMDDYILEKSV
ncbi:MAG: GNAT family N-acetyltransferase [Alphaproteobacteria bacterium]|nr:GNAT family N-acetyltransferase [Alphaproteobacteria bacterium]